MSQRYWFTAIAFGLNLLIFGDAFSQSAEQPVDNQTESDRQKDTGNNTAAPFGLPVRILEEPEESESAKRQQKESSEREEKDLVAQKSMADSTEKIVLLTALQFVLATAGTIALIYTIFLNKAATNAAIFAAKTAKEALALERAWLHLENWNTNEGRNSILNGVAYEKSIMFEPIVRNSGRTIATGVTFYRDYKFTGNDRCPIFDEVLPQQGGHLVPPEGKISCPAVGLVGDDLSSFEQGNGTLWVRILVAYRDTFEKDIVRKTETVTAITFDGYVIDPSNNLSAMRCTKNFIISRAT